MVKQEADIGRGLNVSSRSKPEWTSWTFDASPWSVAEPRGQADGPFDENHCGRPEALAKDHEVEDVCSLRACRRQFSAAEVLVDHFAYLVDPTRPEAFIALGHLLKAKDKNRFLQEMSYGLRARVRCLRSLFLRGRLQSWWEIKPVPIMDILASLRAYSYQNPAVRHVLCKLAAHLFHAADERLQDYLVHDLLHILHSGDPNDLENYTDQCRVCDSFRFWPRRSGRVYQDCVVALTEIVTKPHGKRLHFAAAGALTTITDLVVHVNL